MPLVVTLTEPLLGSATLSHSTEIIDGSGNRQLNSKGTCWMIRNTGKHSSRTLSLGQYHTRV